MTSSKSSSSLSVDASFRRRQPRYAVTLFNRSGWPLFQWIGRSDPTAAKELASCSYLRCATAISDQRTLGEDREALSLDLARTTVVPARGPERWRLNYFPRSAGELAARETQPFGAIGRLETSGLLQEAVFSDARLLRSLVLGAAIEICPFHEWSSTTGWVTIDCAFRACCDGQPARDLRPHSPHLRDAVRLVVLQALLRFPPSRRQALVDRWSVGTVAARSATVRAMLRSRGTVRPARLIAWLRSQGANELADALHAGATP